LGHFGGAYWIRDRRRRSVFDAIVIRIDIVIDERTSVRCDERLS
jgi:hypothetical protein